MIDTCGCLPCIISLITVVTVGHPRVISISWVKLLVMSTSNLVNGFSQSGLVPTVCQELFSKSISNINSFSSLLKKNVYLFERQIDRRREKHLPSAGSFHKCQAKARIQELNPGLPHGCQGPRHLSHLPLLSQGTLSGARHIIRQLDW